MKREEVPTDGEEEVQSACGAGVAPLEKTQAHRPDRLYTWQELKGLPEPDWLIDGVPPKDGLTVLYGAPGLGKTFLALD
jgi:hypothetical protein